jgi:hypothetical protein
VDKEGEFAPLGLVVAHGAAREAGVGIEDKGVFGRQFTEALFFFMFLSPNSRQDNKAITELVESLLRFLG